MVGILIAVVLALVVVAIVSSPWRARRRALSDESTELTAARGEVIELSAARDAKYREIRDTELDHQTGKLSDEDFRAVDDALRAEAIALLKRLDRAQSRVERVAARELEESIGPAPETSEGEPAPVSDSDGEDR